MCVCCSLLIWGAHRARKKRSPWKPSSSSVSQRGSTGPPSLNTPGTCHLSFSPPVTVLISLCARFFVPLTDCFLSHATHFFQFSVTLGWKYICVVRVWSLHTAKHHLLQTTSLWPREQRHLCLSVILLCQRTGLNREERLFCTSRRNGLIIFITMDPFFKPVSASSMILFLHLDANANQSPGYLLSLTPQSVTSLLSPFPCSPVCFHWLAGCSIGKQEQSTMIGGKWDLCSVWSRFPYPTFSFANQFWLKMDITPVDRVDAGSLLLICFSLPLSLLSLNLSFCSETFSFVLTEVDGSRRNGYCRRLLVNRSSMVWFSW